MAAHQIIAEAAAKGAPPDPDGHGDDAPLLEVSALWQPKQPKRHKDRSMYLSSTSTASTELPDEIAEKAVVATTTWPLAAASGLLSRRNCGLVLIQPTTATVKWRDCFEASGYSAGGTIGRSRANSGFSVIDVTKGGRTFAAKMTSEHPGEGILRDTLKREHSVLGRLKHHGIVCAIDLVETVSGCGMVMERCGGVPLMSLLPAGSALCRGGRHAVLERILDAVSYLHGQLVAHTDLHAGNVMVDCAEAPRAGGPTAAAEVKVIDFGSARDVAAGDGDLADSLGIDISPDIRPPECEVGSQLRPLACDVFHAGLLAAGLVTGRSLTTRAVVKKGALTIPDGFLRLTEAGWAHAAAMLSPLPEERPEAPACRATLPSSFDWALGG